MPATASSSPTDQSTYCPTSSFSRVGRLRRLSYLRNYTQNHLSSNLSSAPGTHSSDRINHLARAIGLSQPQSSQSSERSVAAEWSSQPTTGNTHGPSRQCAEGNNRGYSQDRTLQGGISGTSRVGVQASSYPESNAPSVRVRSQNPYTESMVRHRTSTATNGSAVHIPETSRISESRENPLARMASESATNIESNQADGAASSSVQKSDNEGGPKQPATIRFYAYQDPQNSRPSLPFTPMTRTLPSDSSVIRVGRYSERDGIPVPNPAEPSDEPVGFKSKVVSRKHCEFSLVNGQWHIRDVGSSSGTFLNHMRLSQPNMESRHYAVRDGDIVQLGIDFRGGEEMIFRSVRIRIECNRMWQQRANEFNKNTETLISNLGKGNAEGYAGCRECSICLGSVLRPYQCLFMAACAHVWHYKCIRRLIHTPEYPMFQCPNCRAYTDLSAEVDDSNDTYDAAPTVASNGVSMDEASGSGLLANGDAGHHTENGSNALRPGLEDANLAAITERLNLQAGGTPRRAEDNPRPNNEDEPLSLNESEITSTPERRNTHGPNIVIPDPGSPVTHLAVTPQHRRRPSRSETPDPTEHMEDGPLTPRNDSGPLAFDGHAGRL